jgi:hypothetical protein
MNDPIYDQLTLSLPAPWIQHEDRDFAGNAWLLLNAAADQFNEALVAFDLFKPLTMEEARRDPEGTPITEDRVESRLRFLSAKAFVYSLAAAGAFVYVLSKKTGISQATARACKEFQRQFEYIRDIRNSLQHIEGLAQAKGSRGKRLTGPILNLGSLVERRFEVTSGEDGSPLKIEISESVLRSVRAALLEVMWSFDWFGPGFTPVHRIEADA